MNVIEPLEGTAPLMVIWHVGRLTTAVAPIKLVPACQRAMTTLSTTHKTIDMGRVLRSRHDPRPDDQQGTARKARFNDGHIYCRWLVWVCKEQRSSAVIVPGIIGSARMLCVQCVHGCHREMWMRVQ